MANKRHITLRVYDGGSKFSVDRYTLYIPTPSDRVASWGYKGLGLGFSWGIGIAGGRVDDSLIRCNWFECRNGLLDCNLGHKMKREDLPKHVRKWVDKMEELYNRAINLDTDAAWKEWNEFY